MAEVQAERLLKDLAKLWRDLGKQDQDSSQGVLRACSMTLIAAAEGFEAATDAEQTIAELMREHPSRAIVLKIVDAAEPVLDARVFAQCWMPFGKHQQICCEQIEISASKTRLADVHTTLLGLTVPDLPVLLWLKTPQLIYSDEFQPLLRLARSVILDSNLLPADEAIAMMASRRDAGWRIKDLAWTRLTRWREEIAQLFEDGVTEHASHVQRVTISYAGDELPVEARYLRNWIAPLLPKATVEYFKTDNTMPERIQAITFSCDHDELSITACNKQGVDVKQAAVTQRVVFPELNDYALLGEELAILVRDPIYEDVLTRSANEISQPA